jgi:hypothetical protein
MAEIFAKSGLVWRRVGGDVDGAAAKADAFA